LGAAYHTTIAAQVPDFSARFFSQVHRLRTRLTMSSISMERFGPAAIGQALENVRVR
jgi:hypothetical protein